ncbi:MAG: hypothetical protein WBW14_21310, partial [Candidatus Acidiferrum sp.]
FYAILRAIPNKLLGVTALAGGWLCDRGTHSHSRLFRVFLRDPAAVGPIRKNQTGAEFDFRIGIAPWRSDRRVGAATPGHAGVKRTYGTRVV